MVCSYDREPASNSTATQASSSSSQPLPGAAGRTATQDEVNLVATRITAIASAVSTVVLGQDRAVRLSVSCLLAGGHLLVEDVPGVGKTTLARTLAAEVGASWSRIQCTPDLLPSDLTGVHVPTGATVPIVPDSSAGTSRSGELCLPGLNPAVSGMRLRPGPLFAEVVMADELNRASPRTQAALLEAMEERQVSLDGITYPLPRPFFVVATQNPDDFEGTFPLPESQLDRFLFRIELGHPSPQAELKMLENAAHYSGMSEPAPSHPPVTSPAELLVLSEIASRVHLSAPLRHYMVSLAAMTRTEPRLHPGVSPRALLGLAAAAKVWAASEGRIYVLPDDILDLAVPVLSHRLALGLVVEASEVSSLLEEILKSLPVPLLAVD